MVLVRYELSRKTKATIDQGVSNVEPGAGSFSTLASLPSQSYGSTSLVDPGLAIAPPSSEETQESRLQDYTMNLILMEQQNKKRLLMARLGPDEGISEEVNMLANPSSERASSKAQEQDEPLREESNFRGKGSEETKATLSHYHPQLLALEHEHEKKKMVTMQHTAAHSSGPRNQGHDPFTTGGGYLQHGYVDPMQLKLLEQQNKRRLEILRATKMSSHRHESEIPEIPVVDSQEPFMPESEWERPGQDITPEYDVRLVALEDRRR